jgi:hypothetical protein
VPLLVLGEVRQDVPLLSGQWHGGLAGRGAAIRERSFPNIRRIIVPLP